MSRQVEILKLIDKHQRRLQNLKEKKATFGINTPPEILTEIEDIEAEVEDLQEELKDLELQQSPETSSNLSEKSQSDIVKKEGQSPIEVLIANVGLRSTIIASLIGLVGVGLTAYFGYLGIQAQIKVPLEATQTTEAKSTISALSVMPTLLATTVPTTLATIALNSPTPTFTVDAATFSSNAECPEPKIYSSSDNLDNEMISILGTKFFMGDKDIAPPKHEVEVKPFLIDKFEVTNLQYKRFIENTTSHQSPDLWTGTNFPSGEAFHPVVGVSWNDAVAYCKWMGKRLPTEAEWEVACRGKGDYLYPWGDKYNPNLANSSESSCAETLSVGSYSPEGDTSYQISDMLGNVNEWTSSISMDYPYQFDDGREDASNTNEYRAIRGGSFELELLSCVHRLDALPSALKEDIGFRCAKDLTLSP